MRLFLVVVLAVATAVPVAQASADRRTPRAPRAILEVVFVQKEFASTYRVTAKIGRKRLVVSNVKWSFTAPAADPKCDSFIANGPRARWLHGDHHGCSHAAEGPLGHQGVITARFSVDKYTCGVAYHGTNTATVRGRCQRS